MPTTITRYVNTDSTSGGNGTTNATGSGDSNRAYPTLGAALDALIAAYPNLITADVALRVYCSGTTTADTTSWGTPYWNWPTSATNDIIISAFDSSQAATPAGWKTDRYRISVSNYYGGWYATSAEPKYIEVIGLQVENVITFTPGDGQRATVRSTGAYAPIRRIFRNCRFRLTVNVALTSNGGAEVVSVNSNDGEPGFINCIFETAGVSGSQANGFFSYGENWGEPTFLNCLFAGGYRAGTFAGQSAPTSRGIHRNCMYYGHTADITGSAHPSSSHNASSRADAQGSASRQSQTFSFVDATNGDYRLLGTDAGARNYGTDLTSYTSYGYGVSMPVTDDMLGTARPQAGTYDIGVFEVLGGFPYVYLYDSKTNAYTNYTSQASDTTVNDVPGPYHYTAGA